MTTQTDPTIQVFDALRAGATTSNQVQESTALTKSVVGRILRELLEAGRVTKTDGATRFAAATWTIVWPDAEVVGYIETDEDVAAREAGGGGHWTPSETPADETDDAGETNTTPAPVAPSTGGIGDVAAWMESARPTPVPTEEEIMAEKADKKAKEPKAPKEPTRGKCTHPGCPHPEMHKEGRSWLHDAVESDPTFTWDHTATSKAVRVSTSNPDSARRAKGGMGNEIVAWLQDETRRDESFGAGAIAKGIGTQWSGTVGKQCEKLVASGHLIRTAESPGAKYQAA